MSEVRAGGRRRTRAQWEEIIRRGQTNGQSIGAFCAAESVSTASYYLWRKRLTAGGNGGGVREPGAGKFVELGPVPGSRGWEVEVELGGEVVVRFRRG